MKKLFFIAAIAGAALVSCTKNELAPIVDEQPEITFASPVVGVQTKGLALADTEFPEGRDFKVYAEWFAANYTTGQGSAYIKDEVCTKKGSNNYWNPSKPYYWPSGDNAGKLTFAAFSPANAKGGSYDFATGKGIVFTDYVVTTTVDDQVDLLFTEKAYNKTKADMTVDHGDPTSHVYDGIDLCFRHALCDINFYAKTKADYSGTTTITIKQIDIINVASKGTFNQGLVDDDAKVTDMTKQLWTASSDGADYVPYTVYKDLTTGTELNSADEKPLATDGDLMLIPQVMDNEQGDIQVVVSYDIKSADTVIPTTQTISLNASGYPTQWLSSKRYNYTIVVGLDEIYFDPAVYEWSDYTPDPEANI